ncbi:hypothetical protein Poly30_47630 [Planctomycetes bacterium Poly30]|uniref:Uncharacterized protein n=1 Tax=Saltatorellus ferox TaxID=2528018 RepID=A0A518EYN4_9BACT|nr:hypothetical protein Poly30_47630 [Planctomycetes bacterium Poly30]
MRLGILSLTAITVLVAAWISAASDGSRSAPPASAPEQAELLPMSQGLPVARGPIIEVRLSEQFPPPDVASWQPHGVADLSDRLPTTVKTERDHEPVTIHFRAFDGNGVPMANEIVGVSVNLFDGPDGGVTSRPPFPARRPPRLRDGAVRRADAEGRVAIVLTRQFLPDAISVLRVRDEDDYLAAPCSVAVPAGNGIDLGDVRLLPPRARFPAAVTSGTVLDQAGQGIDSVQGRALFRGLTDVDVEIAGGSDLSLVNVHRWQNAADYELVIGPQGAFRLHGPDPDRGTDGSTPSRFALEFEAPGYAPFVIAGVTPGTRGLQLQMARLRPDSERDASHQRPASVTDTAR